MTSIDCVLHGSLEDNLPDGHQGNCIPLEFATTPSVDEILARLGIGREYLQFILADGCYIELQDWEKPAIGERFQLWPRISGG